MFNIGMSEFLVIGALALIFIGPKQLPEVARMVGRLLNELKRAGEEVFGSFSDVRNTATRYREDLKKDLEKNLEDIYKAPEPVIHKGVFKTEEPETSAPVFKNTPHMKINIEVKEPAAQAEKASSQAEKASSQAETPIKNAEETVTASVVNEDDKRGS